MPTLRVVLDTNVVISAIVFESPAMRGFRLAWQRGDFLPLASRETVEELIRVLAYRKLKLTEQDQQDLLEDYLPYVEVVANPKAAATAPKCRDAKDQKFLDLAYSVKADAIVSGDKDLLSLAAESRVPILTPEQFRTNFL